MVQFIIYVADQKRSRDFYEKILNLKPALDVPGITEFLLAENCKLGIMPESGINKILSGKVPHPEKGNGIPRCEIYLHVDNVEEHYMRAIRSGAIEVSKVQKRDWGDIAGYVADFDGHIIAFATEY